MGRRAAALPRARFAVAGPAPGLGPGPGLGRGAAEARGQWRERQQQGALKHAAGWVGAELAAVLPAYWGLWRVGVSRRGDPLLMRGGWLRALS